MKTVLGVGGVLVLFWAVFLLATHPSNDRDWVLNDPRHGLGIGHAGCG